MKNFEELDFTVRKNTNGVWGFIIELGTDAKGKRLQKKSFKKSYRTKGDVTIAANRWIDQYKKNKGFLNIKDIVKLTFKDVSEMWHKEYLEDKNIKTTTKKTSTSVLRTINNTVGNYIYNKLSEEIYYKEINSMDISTAYKKDIRKYISLINKFAIKKNIISNEITFKIDLEKTIKNDEIKYFEKSELKIFLDYIKNNLEYRYYASTYVLAHTGMRVSEMLALKWEDLKDEYLDINKNIFFTRDPKSGTRYELNTPKNGKSRTIILGNNVLKVLKDWKVIQNQEKLKYGNLYLDNNFIFTSNTMLGEPLFQRTYNFNFTKALKESGIKKELTPHKLRHTHISMLASAGVPLLEIKARVGHGDGKVTEKVYLHSTRDMKENTIKKYDEFMKF